MKLWNSCRLVAAESRKVIMASDETPSASGILRGNELVTGVSFLQLPIRAIRRIAAMDRMMRKLFMALRSTVSKCCI
jgi:hypothetical protein